MRLGKNTLQSTSVRPLAVRVVDWIFRQAAIRLTEMFRSQPVPGWLRLSQSEAAEPLCFEEKSRYT